MRVDSRAELSFVDDALAMLERFDRDHDGETYVIGTLKVVGAESGGVLGTIRWDDEQGAWVVR